MPPKKTKSKSSPVKKSTAKRPIVASYSQSSVSPAKKTKSSSANIDIEGLLKSASAPWHDALSAEFVKPYFVSLNASLVAALAAGKTVFPPREQIFETLRLTSIADVRVVLIGQDPYHDNNQAHGLAFSVCHGVAIPPSLRNMYKELHEDEGVDGFTIPKHGCLTSWAEQGVILLNATLTVNAHDANSHAKFGWQTFTDEIIRTISAQCDHVVFLLWGKFAQGKTKIIDAKKHTILTAGHPSPLSIKHFKSCKHFSMANADLVKNGMAPIDWTIPPAEGEGKTPTLHKFFTAKKTK